MATLAEINETLRDQTSSIEDGTKTTAGLRDRFGEFLDRQTGSGDKREQEIEERQKERRQRIIAQRPTNFTQGLSQGLGFGGGFGFGAIAQKILGAMGLAAGTIGLGAGKLLSFGPAIAVMSKFGEKAIGGMVDYIEKEYFEGKQLAPATKEDLVDGVQTALGARLLGVKSPLGLAIAGIVGAYGDTAIAAINEKFGNKDGVYTIPGTDLDIDTQSDAFISGLGVALSFVGPALLRFAGKRLALALALLPIGKGVKALSAAVGLALGIKTASGGSPVYDRNEAKNKGPRNKPPKPLGGSAAASRLLKFNNPPGSGGKAKTIIKPAFPKNPSYVGRGPDGKFMSFNNPLGEGGKAPKSAGGLSAFLDSAKKFNSSMLSTLRLTSKAIPFIGVAAEAGLAQFNDNFGPEMDPASKASAGVLTSPLALVDSLQNLTAMANNLVNTGVNYTLDAAGIDYQFGMMNYSDLAGQAQRAINRGFAQQLQTPSVIGINPPNVGLTAEGFKTDAFPDNPPVSYRAGDTNIRNDTIIQGFGQVKDPASHFLIQVDK